MSSRRRLFAPTDINLLRHDWAAHVTATKIAAKLGRTTAGVRGKIHSLGLTRNHIKRFTPEDIDLLRRDWAAHVPANEIATKLGRTIGTIRQKILSLGLTRNRSVTCALRYAPSELVACRGIMTDDEFVAAVKAWRAGIKQRQAAARTAQVRSACDSIAAGDGSRHTKMQSMRDAGATLQQIGDYFEITRERVRQITSQKYIERTRKQREARGAPIKTILRMWNGMMPCHRAAFLERIRAVIVESVGCPALPKRTPGGAR